MKVLVMSEDTWMEISGALNDWPEALALIAAKVHPVDIPDGCVLAVVEKNKGPIAHRCGRFTTYVQARQGQAINRHYRRVIQEVKL